ncbi:MAG: PIG-L family deacetylase [Erythrobacter sp.]
MRRETMLRNTTGLLGAVLLMAPALGQDAPEVPEDAEDDVIYITPDMAASKSADRLPGQPPELADGETTAPQVVTQRTAPPSVLAILAHPDDEITIAPVLARIAREGGAVTVAFATSGDAGPGVSGMAPGEELAAMREDEARCAAFALGLPEPTFWQLGDGALATLAHHPESAASRLRANIAMLIAETEPRVVMTWGPDGGYGHADHRMVSSAVTEVVQSLRERPELLYPALPAGEDTPNELSDWARTHPSLVTDRIRYDFVDLESTRIAVDCYQTQFDEEARGFLPDLLHRGVWDGQVHFRMAFPATDWPRQSISTR